jgi:hypothetical protein
LEIVDGKMPSGDEDIRVGNQTGNGLRRPQAFFDLRLFSISKAFPKSHDDGCRTFLTEAPTRPEISLVESGL